MQAAIDPLEILEEGRRRRTVAVISHPDAGKSTLTEALLLHAAAIGVAGAVHGKQHRRATVSDWMDMERRRGISITSAAIRFEHRGVQVNLVDTPGHADFSEDTYRVLSAVDSVVMLIDAAKGIETQTLKLFEVCRARRLPVITVINKWDRPGREPLHLLDEVLERTGMLPTPLTWPIGAAGHFRASLDVRTGDVVETRQAAPGALPNANGRLRIPRRPGTGATGPRRATRSTCSWPSTAPTGARSSSPGSPPRCCSAPRFAASA